MNGRVKLSALVLAVSRMRESWDGYTPLKDHQNPTCERGWIIEV